MFQGFDGTFLVPRFQPLPLCSEVQGGIQTGFKAGFFFFFFSIHQLFYKHFFLTQIEGLRTEGVVHSHSKAQLQFWAI